MERKYTEVTLVLCIGNTNSQYMHKWTERSVAFYDGQKQPGVLIAFFLVASYATLHPALSVGWSVGWSHFTYFYVFFFFDRTAPAQMLW